MGDRRKSTVHFTNDVKNVEEVVVIPKKPKMTKIEKDPLDQVVLPLRRAFSDGEMYNRRTSSQAALSTISARTNWVRLVEHLKMKRKLTKNEREKSFIDAIMESKAKRKKGRCAKCKMFAHKLSCLFMGPMFYRHRFRIIIFLEVFVPVLVFLFVSWAFTSGISWKKAYSERKAADARISKQPGATFITQAANENDIIGKFQTNYADTYGRIYLAFSPSNNFTNGIMTDVISILKLNTDVIRVLPVNPHSSIGAAGVDDPLEVLEHALLHRLDRKAHKNPIGIDFTLGDIDPTSKLPHTFKFVIRTFDKTISTTSEKHPYVQPPSKPGAWHPPYVESGFLGLQLAIQKAFLTKIYRALLTETLDQLDNITEPMQRLRKIEQLPLRPDDIAFPEILFKLLFTPNYFDESVRQLITVTICLILSFSYTGLSYFIVRQLVIENQSGIKDFLSLHNMAKYLHWVVYLFHSLVFRTITAVGITTTLFIDYGQGPIFTRSNPLIVYIIIFSHLMSLSAFNFLIGTLLSSVTFSGILSVTICFFSFVFPYCLHKNDLLSDNVNLILTLVFPNWALWNAVSEIVNYECDDVGVNWSNIQVWSNDRVQLTYLQCLFIFAGGFVVYFALAMFRDLTFSKGGPGHQEFSWYGCFQKLLKHSPNPLRFRRITKRVNTMSSSVHPTDDTEVDQPTSTRPLVYERPENSSYCIATIKNLSKTFGQHQLILDNVTLDIVRSEIMAILGPADSGKSTLLQCLAGIVEPTVGGITISGIDLLAKKSKAREYMGYCPQEVVLFNVLSVQEHLILCYKLRGLSTKTAKTYAEGLIQLLRLTDVVKFAPGALTQDERRKLAIALCLVDRPSIVLLDEPTNGMEPLTRHEIWTILKSLKAEGHTIVMTTSFMDEAEFLADRVALLSHGKLVCYGTPKFLRERYDVGYYLRIVPNPAKFSLEAFQSFATTHFKETLREASEKTMFDQRNFLLVLPTQLENYATFFDSLEASKETLGVTAYGAQTIGLSDIFIKMSEAASIGTNPPDIYIRKTPTGGHRSVFWGEIPSDHDASVETTQRVQFKAIMKKLWLFGIGGNMVSFWQLVLPLLLIGLTAWHSHCFVNPPPTPVEREFLLSSFPLAQVYYREQGIIGDGMQWKQHLADILGVQGDKIKKNERLEDIVHEDTEEDRKNLAFTIEKRMIAIELVAPAELRSQFKAYYSSGSLHSPPLVLSILGNLNIRAVTLKLNASKVPYKIIVGNSPFPMVFESAFDLTCGLTCLMFGLSVSITIGIFISLLMTFPILERATRMKQLQFMTGCLPVTYWSAYYVFHAFLGFVVTAVVTLIFLLDSEGIYTSPTVFGTMFVILGLFLCWSGIPWMYFLSTFLPVSIDGALMGFIIHVSFAFIPMLILETGFSDSTDVFTVFLRYFFHIFPPHTLTSAMYIFFDAVSKRSICVSLPEPMKKMCKIDRLHLDQSRYRIDMKQIFEYMVKHDTNLAKCCEKICGPTGSCAKMTSFFTSITNMKNQPRLLVCVIAFILQGILYWTLLMTLESRIISDYWHNVILKFLKTGAEPEDTKIPADIVSEKEAVDRILENGKCPEGTLMVCQNLTKSSIEQMIINDVNIQLKEGDILALLGGTGCGKSVVIKMLAGELVPTRGIVIIGHLNLHKNRKQFLRRISYCPQDDTIFDTFTGSQMMELMGKLRGLPKSDLSIHSTKWLQLFGLAEAAKDPCSSYSSSMRRRLCAAMSLIAGNSIIILDEPTRGLDALAKLRFWSVIRELASRGHAIIFTSASVTECEHNATRLMVLSEGNVQCMGSPELLRHRFSKGFSLLIRLQYQRLTPIEIISTTVGRINELKKTVEKKFKRAILRDEQGNLLLYFISAAGALTWGGIFAAAEQIKEEHRNVVENYFISQSTLDDVFVLLTNRYKDMDLPRSVRSSFPGEMTQEEAEVQALKEATKLKPFD